MFDIDQGRGSIKPKTGGDALGFEKSAFSSDAKANPPSTGQRLSFEVGTDSDSKPCAVKLEKSKLMKRE